jgi:hypothetical protein
VRCELDVEKVGAGNTDGSAGVAEDAGFAFDFIESNFFEEAKGCYRGNGVVSEGFTRLQCFVQV